MSRKYTKRNKERVRLNHIIKRCMLEPGCSKCGSHNKLEFHHRDPRTKSFWIGGANNRSVTSVVREIAKCGVLCHNCHKKADKENRKNGIVKHSEGSVVRV